MYSTFFGIELGKTALLSQQVALHTVAHNISNAVTPGYSRQISDLTAGVPFNLPTANRTQMPGQLGTGVKVDYIHRIRDMLLERQIFTESYTQSNLSNRVDYLGQVEAIINEPSENSLGVALNRFWAGWQDLASYPEDLAVRQGVISRAEQLVSLFQAKDKDLLALQKQADNQIRVDVAKINELAQKIRDLNVQINQSIGIEAAPNDLMDKRDEYTRELSELTNFQRNEMTNGLYSITIGGHTLVQDETVVPLTVVNDPMNNNYALVQWTDDGTNALINDGEIQGVTDIRDAFVPVYRTALNDLAQGLMAEVNPVHAAGFAYNAAAPSGQFFFTGVDLQSMAVNPIITADPNEIAAATNPSAPGDGSNALAIAQLRDALTMSGGTVTFGDFYQSLVGQIGLDSEDAQFSHNTQKILVDSLMKQQESQAGVNLDEEMTDMIRYQDAYQAAIRVISVMDEMLDTLINRMAI